MLFKEELPPPRHTLDAGDFSDADSNVEVSHKIAYELQAPESARLLLLAPKCASFAVDVGAAPRGRVVVTTERRSTASSHTTADFFYDSDTVDASDFVSRQSWVLPVLQGPGELLVVVAAALPEAEAAYAAKHLISHLRPSALYVATPGLSFMAQPVCCLLTRGMDAPQGVPQAEPPVIVQGVGAAALSRARQLDVPALALVVNGDGPVNHEIVDDDKMDELRAALSRALRMPQLGKPRAERDVSTLYV